MCHAITEPGSFRLLILKPGQLEDHLSIELRCAKLADKSLNYEALSYSWHKELAPSVESPSIVICRGIELTVQLTLAAALRRLRSETSNKALWIDALCINQSDIEERNQQVKQMGLIYQTASRTIVWFGESEKVCAEKAFALVCDTVNGRSGKVSASF